MAIRNAIATSATALRVMTSSLPLAVRRASRRAFGLLPLAMLCGTATGAPPVTAITMASRLVENAKAEVILGQAKAAELDGLVAVHRSLPSPVGATSTTLRSVGIILVLVAVAAIGKTACFPSTRVETLARDVVQGANNIDEAVSFHRSVVSATPESLFLDSPVVLSDSDEESVTFDRLFHGIFPSPGRDADSRPTLVIDPNLDVQLTGSQFGLEGLPSVRRSAHMASDGITLVTSPGVSADTDFDISQLDGICKVVDSYRDTDFDFTVDARRDDDSVSVASMVAVFDEDESTDFHLASSSVV